MPANAQNVALDMIRNTRHQLTHGLAKLEHCHAQLADEQAWRRPRQACEIARVSSPTA